MVTLTQVLMHFFERHWRFHCVLYGSENVCYGKQSAEGGINLQYSAQFAAPTIISGLTDAVLIHLNFYKHHTNNN